MNTYNKINESDYSNKVISHVETDPLDKRMDLKKIYSISNDEYFDILEYEVSLINSLRGEIFDTSDPKWSGTGNYEFEFEIDGVNITDKRYPENEHILFKGDVIDIDVDVDVHGTVFLGSTMIDNPGREWTISEATNDKNIGYIVISEIRDIVYTIIEQRLPILKNLGTLDVCDVKEGWVTRLSNQENGKINEAIHETGDNKNFLDKVANMMYSESQKMGKNSFPYDSTQTSFSSYVYNIYGLGYGESKYVFRKFRFLMGWDSYDTTKENMNPEDIDYRNTDDGYLKEGVYNTGDNKDFLEYVYNDLVENTKWRDASFSKIDLFGDCKSINVMISWGSVAPYFLKIPDCVKEKLINLYGLSWKERDKIWDKYEKHIISMILSKKRGIAPHIKRLGLDYLNESVNKKFLDKVVNNLIRETKPTSENHVSVITPFFVDGDRYWILTAHRCREIGITHPENYMIPAIISKHLRDVYSLRSIEEMDYVMDKYYFNIYNKYFRKFFDNTIRGKISESEDLEYNKSYWEKETQLFVKIIGQIMRETVIGYKNNKIKFPIIKFPFDEIMEIDPLDIRDINIIFDSNISNISGDFANNFYRHCKDVYGLKYNEIKRLWPLYSVELIKHIFKVWDKWESYHRSDQGTMGTLLPESAKSVGDNSKFLNKMIDYLVDTTELIEVPHHPKIRVKYPFVDYSPNNKIPHMWYESIPKVIFIVGIMENYGVNKEEAHFVLDEYREKLRDKVKTKLP